MCGLFGFSAYCDQPIKNLSILTNSLAILAGATEGVEAASIAEKLVNGEGLTSISLSMKCL